jgi:hypothetical protein
MEEMYDGIYVKQFLLFYGDNISYYIAEEEEASDSDEDEPGKANLTESGNINIHEVSDTLAGSRYNRINYIGVAGKMQDTETLTALILEYKQLDFLVDEMFKSMKS